MKKLTWATIKGIIISPDAAHMIINEVRVALIIEIKFSIRVYRVEKNIWNFLLRVKPMCISASE